jgi:hypothetical protein
MTLGFFTDPYPDELLYSACARFIEQSGYPNALDAARDLFGSRQVSAIVDLPNRLETFISALPPHHSYTSDRLIDNRTLFPFYSPFIPRDRARIARQEMKMDGANRIRSRLGIPAGGIPLPSQLRYCPICASEDRVRYGETYWHRNHQIIGVEVCFTHALFLETSPAPWRERGRNQIRFYTAEQAVPVAAPRFLEPTNVEHSILLSIARDAAWLLSKQDLTLDSSELRDRYYGLLLERGYAYYNGRIKTYSLSEQLVRFYSQKFLSHLRSEITNPARGWVYRLVHTNTLKVAQPPIRHLLLIKFLRCTAGEFLTAPKEFKPFGDSPWPCLNRASDHYRKPTISSCEITDNLGKGKRGRPIGIFSCQRCGFIYNRVGPDTTDESRFQFNGIQSYGPVWEDKLRGCWENSSFSLGEVGRRLGVSDLTVVRYAIRFGLPMNIPDSRRVSEKTIRRYSSFRRSREEALEYYRNEWLVVKNAHPNATRKDLIVSASFLYLWLRKNDAEWIESNLPPARRVRSIKPHVNWAKVDSDLHAAVIAEAERIKKLIGKPVRASLAEVIRQIGHRTYLEQRLDKLPNTAIAVETCLESLEAFAIRKVKWAENCYREEGHGPTRPQLIRRAVVANKTGRTRTVQSAIDAAMERLSKELH